MHTDSYTSMAYPSYAIYAAAMKFLSISTRSLIIKCCQAQSFPTTQGPVLYNLLEQEPDVIVSHDPRFPSGTYTLIHFLQLINFDPSDPLESAIYLDITRFSQVEPADAEYVKEKGWWKEINLAMGSFREEGIRWDVIFNDDRSFAFLPLHPDLPPNPNMANDIYNSLSRFRARIENDTLYARASHKNMSYSTRRDFEGYTKSSLEGEAIFGQDDYLRFYHETGILLEGSTEMRLRWYTSGAKPRVYFCMGGREYAASRFLQDVFSRLVDSFPSFNHKTRLRPGRLAVPQEVDGEEVHWRIYDLSSFTSNCCIQRSFVLRLAEFLKDVPVVIVDERIGPIEVDLGDLVFDYYSTCVEEPSLSLERYDSDLRDVTFFHEVASMLGIFGNLMTCTFAHGAVVGMSSSDVDSNESYNCAGDDGLIPERLSTGYYIDRGIRLVGSYEPTKSFRGDDEAAICLKRPFLETFPQPTLLPNIIPPCLATCVINLDPTYQDIRYVKFAEEATSWIEKVNVVARDLFRFLRSAYRMGYQDSERLGGIVIGFSRLVRKLVGWNPTPGVHISGIRPYWPVNPNDYEFCDISPFHVMLLYFAPPVVRMEKREVSVDVSLQFDREGDEFRNNSNRRLKLLEMLGYVRKEPVYEDVTDITRQMLLESVLDDEVEKVDPVVYTYTIQKDVPWNFMYAL